LIWAVQPPPSLLFEFLERRFGWGLCAFLSGNLLVLNVFTKNAIDLWAGSLLLVLLFGWNQIAVMICLSAFTALYTMKGGLRLWFTRTWCRGRGSSSAASC
jgi:Na+/proline symporter